VKILSIFITSNKVFLLLGINGNLKTEIFSFYPYFQTKEDLEFLVTSYLKSQALKREEVLILPISTIYNFSIFGKKVNFLSLELNNKSDFCYIYFDNLNFYSTKNIATSSLGLSTRSDNFISNRSVFSANKFTNDIEEIVFLSKSINETYKPEFKKVVLGGDFFSNIEIPNEFKLNLISELLAQGFYEIYLDTKNEYPNLLNLKNNSSLILKNTEFEKFTYLITSEKYLEIMLLNPNSQKYLNLKPNETFFLHFKNEKNLHLKLKGKDIGNLELLLDTEFSGLFIDGRSYINKKKNLGVESFRKVLASIDKDNDYASL